MQKTKLIFIAYLILASFILTACMQPAGGGGVVLIDDTPIGAGEVTVGTAPAAPNDSSTQAPASADFPELIGIWRGGQFDAFGGSAGPAEIEFNSDGSGYLHRRFHVSTADISGLNDVTDSMIWSVSDGRLSIDDGDLLIQFESFEVVHNRTLILRRTSQSDIQLNRVD